MILTRMRLKLSIESRQEKGSVYIWELENDKNEVGSDSSDDSENDESSDSLNVIDGNSCRVVLVCIW